MGKSTLKIDLGDVGFLLFFRVVSGDYGEPCLGRETYITVNRQRFNKNTPFSTFQRSC